jgi:hypothetical protein
MLLTAAVGINRMVVYDIISIFRKGKENKTFRPIVMSGTIF